MSEVLFQSHAGSIEALRFQALRGRRERATLSCIRFSMNITQDALVVKGFGFLHAPGDEGGSAEAFSRKGLLVTLKGSLRPQRKVSSSGYRERRSIPRVHFISLPRTPGGRISHGGPRKVSALSERKVSSQALGASWEKDGVAKDRPRSRRLVYRPRPMIKWSSTRIPSSCPAAIKSRVSATSSGDGSGSPEG